MIILRQYKLFFFDIKICISFLLFLNLCLVYSTIKKKKNLFYVYSEYMFRGCKYTNNTVAINNTCGFTEHDQYIYTHLTF